MVVGPDGMVMGGMLGGVQTRGVCHPHGIWEASKNYQRVVTGLEKSKPFNYQTKGPTMTFRAFRKPQSDFTEALEATT